MSGQHSLKIPIHIVTGFLGSGKTTFIQRILKNDNSQKTLVLINEFGEVGLDDLLVKPIASNTYLLPSGCMCCTVLSDVKETLLSALELNKGDTVFTQVLIETTGLANPASILATLSQDVHLKGRFFVHGMTTIVDASHASNQAKSAPEWLPQVLSCQQFVLSKTDLCTFEQINAVRTLVKTLNPDADEIGANAFVDMMALFAKPLTKPIRPKFFAKQEQQLHNDTQSVVLEFTDKVDWLAFGLWLNLLLANYGEQVLRLKGVLHLKDLDTPILLHGVQHCLYPPEHLDKSLWNDETSRLIMIVRGLDVAQIKRSVQVVLGVLT